MTTTGAASYRRVLAAVACPIVILEEAAEVLFSSLCVCVCVSFLPSAVSVCLPAFCLSVCPCLSFFLFLSPLEKHISLKALI